MAERQADPRCICGAPHSDPLHVVDHQFQLQPPVYPAFEAMSDYQRVAHLRFTHFIDAATITRPDLLVRLHEQDHRAGFAGHTHRSNQDG
jgi:hypothetical protein